MEQEMLQILIAKISAISALAGSVIGALATLASIWLDKKLKEKGRISVYCRIVGSLLDGKEFGIYQYKDGLIMRIPMWIEVCNTSGISRFIRDVNVVGCIGENEVCEFTQLQGANLGKDNELLYGDNEAYTFVIEANSTKRFKCEFGLKQRDLTDDSKLIDSLLIRYYDENNKKHVKEFYKFTDNPKWAIRKFVYKKQWFEVNSKMKVSMGG